MNGQTTTVRVNISLPSDLVRDLKRRTRPRQMSKFLAEAAEEKMMKERREKALKELLAGPPAFTDIKDSVAYIREMRRLDEKRLKRLGI